MLVSFKDQKLSTQFLTKDQLQQAIPVAFKEIPTNPKVSKKYVHINTSTVIEDLAKLGWFPVEAKQRRTRKSQTIFSKHMVVFQNPDLKIKSSDGDDAFPRIILTNSSDGFNSFQFRVGIYRLICSNGLVLADEEFSSFKIRHMGYTFEELQNTVTTAIEDLPNKLEILNKMQERVLTQEEKAQFAANALKIRAGISLNEEKNYDSLTLEDILAPAREEDEGDSLWKTFNILQEKIIRGGFSAALVGAKVRKVRPIKSFEKDLKVNQELFKLATSLINSPSYN
jgi:hypothetical protein